MISKVSQEAVCIHLKSYRQMGIQFGGNRLIKTEICSLCNKILKIT